VLCSAPNATIWSPLYLSLLGIRCSTTSARPTPLGSAPPRDRLQLPEHGTSHGTVDVVQAPVRGGIAPRPIDMSQPSRSTRIAALAPCTAAPPRKPTPPPIFHARYACYVELSCLSAARIAPTDASAGPMRSSIHVVRFRQNSDQGPVFNSRPWLYDDADDAWRRSFLSRGDFHLGWRPARVSTSPAFNIMPLGRIRVQ
jgi:hypothetical protein